jgi:hypothetical protein
VKRPKEPTSRLGTWVPAAAAPVVRGLQAQAHREVARRHLLLADELDGRRSRIVTEAQSGPCAVCGQWLTQAICGDCAKGVSA